MIGISYITRNRYHVLKYSLERLAVPKDSTVVIIDDHSVDWKRNKALVRGLGFIYLRNEIRRGIPFSKERGFRCLQHCTHQFWFDDDCYPKVVGWEEPFIGAMQFQGHLLHLKPWAHVSPLQTYPQGITQYSGATACFMTFRKDMYKDIPGIGANPKMYGNRWHPDLSEKMAKYGVGEFVALTRSADYLHSFDIDGVPSDFDYSFMSSVDPKERRNERKTM